MEPDLPTPRLHAAVGPEPVRAATDDEIPGLDRIEHAFGPLGLAIGKAVGDTLLQRRARYPLGAIAVALGHLETKAVHHQHIEDSGLPDRPAPGLSFVPPHGVPILAPPGTPRFSPNHGLSQSRLSGNLSAPDLGASLAVDLMGEYPTVGVVVRTKDEADRLRLTLASLTRDTPDEVIVVDDGSSDHTPDVIDRASLSLPIVRRRHERPLGRCEASNAGAALARSDLLVFLDGDTLAGPGCLRRHAMAHGRTAGLIGRGETFHLRSTRFFLDPQTASPRPGEEARVARMTAAEQERARVTLEQVKADFDVIHRRAEPGIYPGAGPRRLYDLEIEALRDHPDCDVLWAASSGSNFSVRRADFLRAGGFDDRLTINEHRELAFRLCQAGGRMGFVAGARTYHLTHRSGWRDPLTESDWESVFYARHPLPAVKLLSVLWASLADRAAIPEPLRITSLPGLSNAIQRRTDADHDLARSYIRGLGALAVESRAGSHGA
jgi:glycosyltransferase involved in cell wall biosynthesis